MSRVPSDPEWLRKSLLQAYRMRDIVNDLSKEAEASGAESIQDRIARSQVRLTVEGWIAYYSRELSIIARRGGHGHRVQGAASRPRNGASSDGSRPAGCAALLEHAHAHSTVQDS
jgi:hypothetical protein